MITGGREVYILKSLASHGSYVPERHHSWQDQGLMGNLEFEEPLVPLTLIKACILFYFKNCNSVFKNIISACNILIRILE
jgi:hypothetical protein